jgi:hypothetical protein
MELCRSRLVNVAAVIMRYSTKSRAARSHSSAHHHSPSLFLPTTLFLGLHFPRLSPQQREATICKKFWGKKEKKNWISIFFFPYRQASRKSPLTTSTTSRIHNRYQLSTRHGYDQRQKGKSLLSYFFYIKEKKKEKLIYRANLLQTKLQSLSSLFIALRKSLERGKRWHHFQPPGPTLFYGWK